MYGPISPHTNAIGRIAAITVKVARMVGLPTSSTPPPPPTSGVSVAHLQVAVDVLDHHDGVVHQDADREDQREERDPVERVAQRVVGEERERERHRHRDQHDQRLAPAQEDPDEHRHRERGDEQVEDQLVRLLAAPSRRSRGSPSTLTSGGSSRARACVHPLEHRARRRRWRSRRGAWRPRGHRLLARARPARRAPT